MYKWFFFYFITVMIYDFIDFLHYMTRSYTYGINIAEILPCTYKIDVMRIAS